MGYFIMILGIVSMVMLALLDRYPVLSIPLFVFFIYLGTILSYIIMRDFDALGED